MPFVYGLQSKMVAETFSTSGTPNTAIDASFIKPGSSRVVALLALRVQGRGAGLTSLSGIAFRIEQWTTTAGAGGTATTPAPVDNRAPAAVATSGMASAGVTDGTGGPNYVGGCGCGASGPGGWVAPNLDSPPTLDGGANKSINVFVSSGTASMAYEMWQEIQE